MIHGDDVVLGVLPLFHVYGLNAVLGGVLRHRAKLVLVERFDPQGTLDLMILTILAREPFPSPLVQDDLRAAKELATGLDGRHLVIQGPPGSGKTTLFRTAMRLLKLTAGEILVDGRSTADRTVAQLATVFGYVFQSPSQMLFARTVREELAFGPRNLIEADWFRWVATVNPVSYLIEAVRSLVIEGWNWEALGLGFAAAGGLSLVGFVLATRALWRRLERT